MGARYMVVAVLALATITGRAEDLKGLGQTGGTQAMAGASVKLENLKQPPLNTTMNAAYLKIADNLKRASEKTMDPEAKIGLLKATKQLETAAIEQVEALATALRAPKRP